MIPPTVGKSETADSDLRTTARALYDALSKRELKVACAESCTGGIVTAAITDAPGSSAVLWGGIVAYSNDCKSRLLGVPPDLIAKHGAVSREVARAMAEGALEAAGANGADIALAVTGIAGPEGGSAEKPVGLVWFAWKRRGEPALEESVVFPGDRASIREAAAEWALIGATALVQRIPSARGRY